ncbi:MAG: response regulator [Candidatus Thorarchaeota archaeon]|nr:MAG: response regulator [Candidatus Thorarchaeota archaeon]
MNTIFEETVSKISNQARILVVDDNLSTCITLKKILHQKGHLTYLAGSGAEAIQHLKMTQFDMAILDLILPDMSGIDVLDQIMMIQPELVVIMATGHASVESAIKAVKKNVIAYITKPIDMDNLLRLIQNNLQKQVLQREKEIAERALRESEIRFRVLAEKSPQGIAILKNDKIIYSNGTIADILGYEIEQILQLPSEGMWNFIHPKDREQLLHLYSDHQSNISINPRAEFRIVRSDGTIRFIEAFATLVESEGEDAIQIMIIDRTNEKKAEEIKIQYQKEIEIYNSLIRHDLGNDLQLIISELEFLQLSMNDITEDSAMSLQSAIAGVDRMYDLVTSLKKPADEIENRILFLLRELINQFQKSNPELTIAVNSKEEAESLSVRGSCLLPMVFTNLFTNTAKHCGVNANINITVSRVNDNVVVDIVDDGPGVSPIILDKLFTRGVSTTGGGLGLYLSKRLLNAIDGSIEYIFEKQQGAHFRVVLQLSQE